MDEPTAALNEDDSENLLGLLRELKEHGVTSIMISHKIKEVIEIADTVTVLRDGRTVASMSARDGGILEGNIIKHMVGREIENIFLQETSKYEEKTLEVNNWNACDSKTGREILKDMSFFVKKGEIVGIAGLMGAGRTELAHSIFGNPDEYRISGDLYVMGKKKHFRGPHDAIKAGVAYVTEDRKGNGLILISDIKTNITIANLKALAKQGIVNENEEVKTANYYKGSLDIKAPVIEQKLRTSGGNQQKVSPREVAVR